MRLNNSHVINELYQFNYKDINMHALDLDLTSFLNSLENWNDIFYYDNNLYILDFYTTGVNYKVNLETKEIVQLTYTFDSDVLLNGYYDLIGGTCRNHILIIESPDYDAYNVHLLTLGEDIIDTPISIISDKGYGIYDISPDVIMTDVYNDDILYFSCITDAEEKLNDIMYKLDTKKGTIESMNINIEEEAKDLPGTFEFAYISHGRLKVVFRIDKYFVFYEYAEALNRFNEIDRIIATYTGYGFTHFKNNHIILNYRLNEYIGILVYDLHTHEKYLTPRMANSLRDVWFIDEGMMADNDNDGHIYRLEKCDKAALDKKADKTYVDEQISNISNNGITEAELDLLLEEIFGINSKNELTSVRLGNYQMKYDNVNDTLDFIYNGTTEEPEVPPTPEEEIIPLVWAVGNLSGTDGSETVQENSLRSDFATIVSGSTYSFYLDAQMGDPKGVRIYFYDSSKTFISRTSGFDLNYTTGVDIPIDIPSNTGYIRFKANLDSSTTLDNINSLVTLRKRKTAIVNNYVREGLSLYIDADDVATYGSVRDITGKQNITNHGVSTTLDNGCLNFVANESDYIDTGLVPNLTTWSAEVYFYFTDTPGVDTQVIFGWGVSGSKVRIGYSDDAGALVAQSNNESNYTIANVSDLLSPLHHLIVTMNNGALTSYLDGVKSVLCSSGGTQASHTGTLKIGSKYNGTEQFANIHLKSLRFYDGKVLTDEEVLQNYNYEINRCESIIAVTWKDGKSLTSDGGIVVNEQAVVTDYIKIDNNYNYTINYTDKVTEVRLAYYDNNNTFISRGDYLTSGAVDTVVEFPENTVYVRIKAEKVGITVNEVNDNIIFKKVLK